MKKIFITAVIVAGLTIGFNKFIAPLMAKTGF